MRTENAGKGLVAALALFAIAGCAPATVDPQAVRATQYAPPSTQVDVVRIPHDPNLPWYVVTVEPLTVGVEGSGSPPPQAPGVVRYGWGSWGWGLLPTGPQAQPYDGGNQQVSARMGDAVASQLTTALSNAGNVRVIEWDYFRQYQGDPARLVNRKAGEVGPFVIRGTITEFNEVAQAAGQSTGGSLGALGAALAIGGAIAGNNPATYTGIGVAAANPTYENTVAQRTGSVAMDLRIVEPSNGRILGSFVANGSFTSQSAANGFSLFGFGTASNAYAASALGQAQRAAMNSATSQIAQRLSALR
ncbi:hypothetical protein KGQ64_05925 [bacterium]|nr:hypothetical protein [bacterium]